MARKILIWAIFYAATIVAASSAVMWEIQSYYFALEQPFFCTTCLAVRTSVDHPIYLHRHHRLPDRDGATNGHQANIDRVVDTSIRAEHDLDPELFWGAKSRRRLIYISALDVTVLITMALLWNRDRISFWLAAPYMAWIGFATALNAGFFILNG